MDRLPHAEVEHLIVGGGVIGLALAYELMLRGHDVLVLERGRPGGGATAVAGGMLAPVSEAGQDPQELIELGCDSLRRFPGFVSGLEQVADGAPLDVHNVDVAIL